MIPERGVHESESCSKCRYFKPPSRCTKYNGWTSKFKAGDLSPPEIEKLSKRVTCEDFVWSPPSSAEHGQSVLRG